METIDSELLTEPNIDVPRLTFNRAFMGPDEFSGYAKDKDNILNSLNDAIVDNPDGVLGDIAWLEDELAWDIPIETRSIVAINENHDDEGWSARRPHIGIIRDALSITSNGSQFDFGTSPQQHDAGWTTVFDKCNEIDREEIRNAQARVFETRAKLRAAQNAEAERQKESKKKDQAVQPVDDESITIPEIESDVEMWERLNTVAKQQRALIRLRALAMIARGPELEIEIPAQATEVRAEELVVAPRPRSAVKRAANMLVRAASAFTL